MARYMHEFFRSRVGMSLVFPIGVIAQDRDGAVYVALRDIRLPDDVDADFYGLDHREAFMNDDFLASIEVSDPETGEPVVLDPSDQRVLESLRRKGTHHFIYGPIRTRRGSAADVAAEESSRLGDKDARRAAVNEVLDPATRAALEIYA